MAELEVLEELGLSEAEAKVYLALLETGSTLAGTIIKKTGLHRGTTYQILQRLKEKGLVSSVIKGKKQYFEPVSPERLMDILKEKQERLQEFLPILKARTEFSKDKQDVTVYSGIRGIRSVLDKMLEELGPHGEYYDFGVSGLFRNVIGPYWDLWQKRKRKNNIKSHVIFNEELKRTNPKLLQEYYGKARFHPKEYASMTDTMIYKDTVIMFIWTAKPPIAVIIKNKENAESYKNQFRLMWRFAKP
ncbi:BlaI/MecI/CopY family transcriptional regulator [Candidatus Woesearchaeota archaeon]|nr:BlaI/MecI/CopY family transcriptional regulator [Candidatus Woesearchaeota archaeon]